MKYGFAEIVDIPQMRLIFEEFYAATGIPSGIIDVEGNLLVSVGWRDICANFHRVNPDSAALCRESDRWLQAHYSWDDYFTWHTCAHGLIDAAAPIVLEGQIMAAIFQGQFFFHPPDLEFFRSQAARFGFDEQNYLQALAQVPIYSREKLVGIMNYFRRLAEMFAGIGLANLKLRQMQERVLRESAERLNTIISHSPSVAIQSYDRDGQIIFWNRASETMFGWSETEAVGKTLDRLILRQAKADEFLQAVRDCARDCQPQPPRLWPAVTKFGREKTVISAMFPIRIGDNDPEVICMDVDVSQQKNLEKEISRLEQLHLVGEMAANIGHEIRNPITTVRGFLQLLATKEDCSGYRDFFDLMIRELDQANGVITEFLSLAKNRSVQMEMKNLNQIIASMAPLIEANFLSQGQQLKLNLGPVATLLLDEKDIRRLILHLTRNGMEAMLPGGQLTISTYMEDTCVVLAIQDEGWGIEKDLLDKIGRPFLSTKDNNPGLGLAVCYNIAARHQARISVDSSPQGTTFYITFTPNDPESLSQSNPPA